MAAPGALFVLGAGLALAKTARDAAFLAGPGLSVLPAMYVTIALLGVPFGFGTLGVMRRLGGRRTHAWLSVATAVGLCGLSVRPPSGIGLGSVVAYVAVPLVFGVLFSMTWLVVPSSVMTRDGGPHPRAFLFAGAASLIGGTCGGIVAASGRTLATGALLFVEAGGLVLIGAWLLARAPCRVASASSASLTEASGHSQSSGPHVGLLASSAVLAAMVGVFVEYQFYAAVVEASSTGDPTARLAGLHVGVNGVALVGLLMTPGLQRRAGVGGALAMLPAAVATGAGTVWFGGAASSRALLRAAEGGLKASVHRVSWEQMLLWLPPTVRPRVKMMLDGMATRMAEGGAGLLLIAMSAAGVAPRVVSGTLVLLAATWLVVVVRLWRATAHLPVEEGEGAGRLPDS